MERTSPQPAPGETLDLLAGSWRIFQLRRGHRYSTDDVLTAWTGCAARPRAGRLLDLGAGIGSVGLMTLMRMPPAADLTSVEVQRVSAALLRKTVRLNGLQERVTVLHDDLRRPGLLDGAAPFDLILANPPYIPEGNGSRSPNPQRAAARLELHGDIFDYCRVAARLLGPGGRFCFSHSAKDPRPAEAIRAAGLSRLSRREVVFRAGRGPHLALFTCGVDGDQAEPPTLTIRGGDGEWTAAYLAVRREMRIDP